jgi:hypothetical protein
MNALPNDTALQEFMADSRELGRELAAGKDALPKWAMKVAQAAANGVLSDVKDADGHDDVARAYIDLMKAASKKAVHEHTPAGLKANISKARQIKHAAEKPTCDFIGTLNKTFEKRQDMIAAGEKVKPAYSAYVDAARTQLVQDDDLTNDQIESVIRKAGPEEPTVEKMLGKIEKAMEDLITGEKGVKYEESDFMQAHELVRGCLAALQVKTKRQAVIDAAASLGMSVVSEPTYEEAASLAA